LTIKEIYEPILQLPSEKSKAPIVNKTSDREYVTFNEKENNNFINKTIFLVFVVLLIFTILIKLVRLKNLNKNENEKEAKA
jgi:preprotein translocase subunit SecG